MLPFERWDAGGMALTIGVLPLLTANALAGAYLGDRRLKKPVRLFFFLPSILCMGIVAHYWFTSLTA